MSKLITNTIRHTGGSADNITLTSGGHVLLGDGGNDNAFFKAHAADGEASDLYVGQFINAEATAGVNYGVNIQGGSNSTDHGLRVKNHAGTAQLLVRGDGEVQIGSGDLVFGTAGKGICLGVTSNTDSNTLDDYEEGTHTMAFNNGNVTLTNNIARYTKIGRLVHVSGFLQFSAVSGSNSIEVTLPFTQVANDGSTHSRAVGALMYMNLNISSSYNDVVSYVGGGQNYWRMYSVGDDNNWSQMDNSNIATDTEIQFNITYTAA